jgi:hypothetical protein
MRSKREPKWGSRSCGVTPPASVMIVLGWGQGPRHPGGARARVSGLRQRGHRAALRGASESRRVPHQQRGCSGTPRSAVGLCYAGTRSNRQLTTQVMTVLEPAANPQLEHLANS